MMVANILELLIEFLKGIAGPNLLDLSCASSVLVLVNVDEVPRLNLDLV